MLSRTARLNQVVHLADGRTLGYAEYGPATGPALFLFHGLPGSRLAAAGMWSMEHPLIRVIAPDRPGFGLSTFQPGRRLTDWAAKHGGVSLAESAAGPYVESQRSGIAIAGTDQIDECRSEHWGHIVQAREAEIFKRFHGLALACT